MQRPSKQQQLGTSLLENQDWFMITKWKTLSPGKSTSVEPHGGGMGEGGQFQWMAGLMKQSLYKTVGKANLSWQELEVLLDIQIMLNNWP